MGMIPLIILLAWASSLTQAGPFLNNAPRAITTLAASASASASSPAEPITHIADLRVKQQKAQQLQAEKLLAEEEDDDTATFPEDDDETNEASPSLLRKKVNKILTKLRIISRISQGINGDNGASARIINTAENQGKEEDDLENQTIANSEENSTEDVATFQKIIYPHSGYGVPIKLRLNLSERQVDASGDELEIEAQSMGRLEQIGVFFAELLGSIVGLVYGAAATINNSVQGTTAPNID